MVVVKGSYEPLLSSNYQAILELGELTVDKLRRNSGLWFALIYFGSYFVFSFLGAMMDRRELKGKLL